MKNYTHGQHPNHLENQNHPQLLIQDYKYQKQKNNKNFTPCINQSRINRIASLQSLQIKRKPILHNQQQKLDEFSRVDILQDTNLQQTIAVLELLLHQEKQKNRSINIHRLKTKQPFKIENSSRMLTERTMRSNGSEYNQKVKQFDSNKIFEVNEKQSIKYQDMRILSKEIQQILQNNIIKKNVMINTNEKQNNKRFHRLNNIKGKQKKQDLKLKSNNRNISTRKNIKLTINIKQTIKNCRKIPIH